MSEAPDCLRCGACCFSDNPAAVRVTGEDFERLGDELASRLTNFIEHRCYMRVQDDRCAALSVRADGTFACSIYAVRPTVCRELQRESAACNAERWEKVHRTVHALRVVRSRL